jgi:uncharacterized protein
MGQPDWGTSTAGECPPRARRAPALLALLAPALLAGCTDRASGENKRFYNIGTGGTGGVYYPLGGAIAARLSESDPDRTYTAEVTSASGENVNRIMSGEMDLGFAISTTVYEAYNGGEGFATPATRLRVIAPLHPNATHVLVGAGSQIESIAELRGLRVSVGSGGSGTEQVARQLLEAHGLDYGAIQQRYLSFNESTAALTDGAIDAAILSVGYPASAVLEALATGRARLIGIDPAMIEALSERYPYYSAGVIPAGTYPGQDTQLATLAVLNWIVARDDLPAPVARAVLEVLQTQRDALAQTAGIASQINLSNLFAAPIPLHPEVRAWLNEGARPGSADSADTVTR